MKNCKYLVCARCSTYNNAPYIEETLRGFCAQITQFPVVYVIIDDASNDGTSEIINKFIKENFNIFDEKTMRYEETNNYLMTYARHKTVNNCFIAYYRLKFNHYSNPETRRKRFDYVKEFQNQSKYIALCEGDDYWIDKDKLQKQVSFLNANPEYSACFHSYNFLRKDCIERNDKHVDYECDYDAGAFIRYGGLFCHTSSLVYREEYNNDMPKFRQMAISGCGYGDWPLIILLSLRGKVHYLPEVMSCYRYLHEGSWTVRTTKNKEKNFNHLNKEIGWLRELDAYSNGKYKDDIQYRICLSKIPLYKMGRVSKKEVYKEIDKVASDLDQKVLKWDLFVHHHPLLIKLVQSAKRFFRTTK